MNKPLPKLEDWDTTRDVLRGALQPLRTARFLGSDPLPNQLEYSVFPMSYGATTGPLNFGGELILDYKRLVVEYLNDGEVLFSISLKGHNQQSLFDAVFKEFKKLKLLVDPDSQRDISHHREDKIKDTTKFKPIASKAKEYAAAQYRVFNSMSVCRSRLLGIQTPIVLWPHGFDLSFIWFLKGLDEKKDPHVHFGFSPGFDEQRPYLYFYAWPVPDGLVGSDLPRNGEWIEQWSAPGGSFQYDEFANDSNPEESIAETLLEVFRSTSLMM